MQKNLIGLALLLLVGFPIQSRAKETLSPVPDWIQKIYEDDYQGYQFALPKTVKKGHPRLPYPSEKICDYYRKLGMKQLLKQEPKFGKNPALLYVITKDKQYLDRACEWIKNTSIPSMDRGIGASAQWGFTLDWLYNDLPEDVRKIAIGKCAALADRNLNSRYTSGRSFSAVQTLAVNRYSLAGQAEAIAVWGHTPKGDELLKIAHKIYFRGCMPMWHVAMGPDGGAFSHPNYPFYGDIMQQTLPWSLEMWSSFLGENLFPKYPWFRAYGYAPIHTTLPNLCSLPLGDCTRTGAVDTPASQCAVLADRYDDPYIRWAAYRYAHRTQVVPRFGTQKYGWWAEHDPTGKPRRPPEDGLPTERFFRGFGLLSMRSDWTEDATFALFKLGDITTNHTHTDSGHFFIYRNGALATDRGTQDGNYTHSGNHYRHFTPLAIAHNVITIRDPADPFVPNDGGQRGAAAQLGFAGQPTDLKAWLTEEPYDRGHGVTSYNSGRRQFETGDMLAYDPHEKYVYAAGEYSAAYQNAYSGPHEKKSGDVYSPTHPMYRTKRLKTLTRAFLYIRPDFFAVFDRVDALQPEFEKRWLLQMATEPKIDGDVITVVRNDLVKSLYPMRIQRQKRKQRDELQQYQLHGKMFCKTLLPKLHTIEAVGGPGKEFWVDGKNYNQMAKKIVDPTPRPNDIGSWRIEVRPKKQQKEDFFLHVIQVGDSKELKKMVPVESYEQGDQVGFKMKANGGVYTVTFNKSGIGGHIKFVKGGRSVIDRDFSEEIRPDRPIPGWK